MPPRKKQIAKAPVALEIQIHGGDSSPHVLDLRSAAPNSQSAPTAERNVRKENKLVIKPSLEERVALLDRKLKRMPGVFRGRTNDLVNFWDSERKSWEKATSSFFKRAADWGVQIQNRLKTHGKENILRAKSNAAHFSRAGALLANNPSRFKKLKESLSWPVAHQLRARLSPFLLFLVLLAVLSIPLQALLIYRAIDRTKRDVAYHWISGIAHAQAISNALAQGDPELFKQELAGATGDIKALSNTIASLGPLRLLSDRLRLAENMLAFAQAGASGVQAVLNRVADLQKGSAQVSDILGIVRIESEVLAKKIRPFASRGMFLSLADKLDTLRDAVVVVDDLAGSAGPRNILLVFQNPRELRATGGFAGSFALLTIDKGRIEKMEAPVGGTYAVQGQMPLRRVSPEPLHLINARFEFQDSNWWPDFSISARKMAELYEASGASTIDAVVGITATVGTEILKLTGSLKTLDGEVSADNFIDILQETIARDRALDHKSPKKIISVLLPSMFDAVSENLSKQPKEFAALMLKSLTAKDIQLWSRSEEAQAAIRRLGLSGELKKTSGDYLAVITSNVGGGKTDGVVKEEISHEVRIGGGEKAYETVRIRRMHLGQKGNRFTGGRNWSYMRVYVPKGARLIQASGFTSPPPRLFEEPEADLDPDPDVRITEGSRKIDGESGTEIWDEADKTVFGNFIMVDPGDSREATLVYEVPLLTNGRAVPYSLTVDNQAGKDALLSSTLILDDSVRVLTGNQEGLWRADGWNFNGRLNRTIAASGVLYKM